MFYVTGDTHTPIDIHKLCTKCFPAQREMSKKDYVIVTGDFGAVWNGSNTDKYWLKWFNDKPFTTIFVDGNHENFDLLNRYPIKEWNGGNVHVIMPSVYHLMRGQVFTIDGKTFFTMGGAKSTDISDRKENISWWEDEMPNDDEYKTAWKNLEKHNFNVDYIITHCAPTSIKKNVFKYSEDDRLTNFLDEVLYSCSFKHWYCGHYHIDYYATPEFSFKYYGVTKIDE
jgi:hypothetical protein